MHLMSFSLSHRTAPVGAREAVARAFGDVGARLAGWRDCAAIPEMLVIATCHRFERLVAMADALGGRTALAEACAVRPDDLDGHGSHGWVVRHGVDAATHLARVTAGLDSLVVGEAEIAGQVRRSVAVARDAGAMGPMLETVVAGAFRASGRARSETRIAAGVTSAASAGVLAAASALGTLEGRSVLVIGAGQAARTALGRLSRAKLAEVVVASRSPRHAAEAASIANGRVVGVDEIPLALSRADAVVAATVSDTYLLTCEMARVAFAAEPGRVRVLVDLSVPRVIDPAVGRCGQVRLVSVDDLGDVACQSLRRREREVPQAEAIASAEGRRAFERLETRAIPSSASGTSATSRIAGS